MATETRSVLVGLLFFICVVQICVFISITIVHLREQAELGREFTALQTKISFLKANCDPLSVRGLMSSAYSHVLDNGRHRKGHSRYTRANSASVDTILSNMTRTQESLLEKHCGNASKLCISGPRGDTGDIGDTGVHGNQGLPGINGPTGSRGPAGSKGAQGTLGQKGSLGIKGDKGPRGIQGLAGPKGASGPQGPAGDVGVSGPVGAKGSRGDPGSKGVIGHRGKHGAPGVAGGKGDQGPKGQQGQKGSRGQHGHAAVIPNCGCVPTAHVIGNSDRYINPFLGDHVTLKCTTTRYPPILITWHRDGRLLSSGGDISVKGDVLQLNITGATDSGTYVCTTGQAHINYHVSVIDFDCNFEKTNTCSWHVKTPANPLTWTLHKGVTSSLDTGPDADHTTASGHGHYIYIESSLGQKNDAASLLSPFVKPDRPMCVTFFYSMYGSDIGKLEVATETENGTVSVLWSKSTNQGRGWKTASLTVPKTGFRFRILLRAYRGSGYHSDIGVDDVVVRPGRCQSAIKLHCDFDKGLCGWTQSKSDNFDWTRNTAATMSSETGPAKDHTSGFGYYMYTESSSPRRHGDKAELVSPGLSLTGPICFSFWYNMYGSSMGSLKILAKENRGSVTPEIWSSSGNKGFAWFYEQLTIPANTNNIVIQGIVGNSFKSDMAIDDVSAISGPCQRPIFRIS